MTKFLNETRQHGLLYSANEQGSDLMEVVIPPDEVFHSCRLTILETHFGGSAKLISMPASGQNGKAEVVVAWQCAENAGVKYQLEAFSRPASSSVDINTITRTMTSFLPSHNGWPFDNQFESIPPFKLIGELRYGDASKGLCGGMVYAALDYFVAGLDLPQIPEKDISLRYGSPLHGPIFDYLGKRLFSSFNIPDGVWEYIELMHPKFPDSQISKGRLSIPPRSRAWRMVRQEWPIIKSKLDNELHCPLGLVRVISTDVSRLGENHQVLAYGYDLLGDDLTLFIYDPNFHNNDAVTLRLNISSPEHKVDVSYWDRRPVFCFFHSDYTFSIPPEEQSTPGRIILFEDENFCGKSIDIIREHPDLSAHKAGSFNNCTSSFVILSGEWNLFLNANFETPVMHNGAPLILGAGAYSRVADLGIQDNEITSLRAVNSSVWQERLSPEA